MVGTVVGKLILGVSAAAACSSGLPDTVNLRSRSQTYNDAYAFAVRDGGICFKSAAGGSWQALTLPNDLAGQVQEISADDQDLIAIGKDRAIYTMKGGLSSPSKFKWRKRWGAPLWMGSGMSLPADTLDWDISYDSSRDHDYTDTAGHRHWVGGGCTTLYALREDRQRITYLDPWLPADDSYEVCGPKRGRFKMRSLSASGSTLFVMNELGDMYTRQYDFDIGGGDWVFFFYSWNDQSAKRDTILRQLPADPWARQPKIPGLITDRISIFKLEQHGVHRILRVEGLDGSGRTGYWEKDLDPGLDWEFHATGAPLQGKLLEGNSLADTSDSTLGESSSLSYRGDGAELTGFDPYCSPAELRIDLGEKEPLLLRLHTTETIRFGKRARGLDGNVMPLRGSIEVPAETFERIEALSPLKRRFIREKLNGNRFSRVHVSATSERIEITKTTTRLHLKMETVK